MTMETLTLPSDVVSAARAYAARERRSVADIVLDALKKTYGIDLVYVFDDSAPRNASSVAQEAKRGKRAAANDNGWLDEIDPRVRSLIGAFRLPPEDAGKSDKQLLHEALAEKYGL